MQEESKQYFKKLEKSLFLISTALPKYARQMEQTESDVNSTLKAYVWTGLLLLKGPWG